MSESRPAHAVAPVLVLGVGSSMRGDDGVGPAVVAGVAERSGSSAAVEVRLLDGEPARIVEAWTGRAVVLLVDAVCRGEAPGTLLRLEVGEGSTFASAHVASTHAGGVGDAIELGRVLERLPDRLIVFGMEPGDMSVGAGLSAECAAAVPALTESVLAELRAVAA